MYIRSKVYLVLSVGTWEAHQFPDTAVRAVNRLGPFAQVFECEYPGYYGSETFASFILSLCPDCLPKLLAQVNMFPNLNPHFSKVIASVLGDSTEESE